MFSFPTPQGLSGCAAILADYLRLCLRALRAMMVSLQGPS